MWGKGLNRWKSAHEALEHVKELDLDGWDHAIVACGEYGVRFVSHLSV
jgi:hypothetical protein